MSCALELRDEATWPANINFVHINIVNQLALEVVSIPLALFAVRDLGESKEHLEGRVFVFLA